MGTISCFWYVSGLKEFIYDFEKFSTDETTSPNTLIIISFFFISIFSILFFVSLFIKHFSFIFLFHTLELSFFYSYTTFRISYEHSISWHFVLALRFALLLQLPQPRGYLCKKFHSLEIQTYKIITQNQNK